MKEQLLGCERDFFFLFDDGERCKFWWNLCWKGGNMTAIIITDHGLLETILQFLYCCLNRLTPFVRTHHEQISRSEFYLKIVLQTGLSK